MIAERTKNNLEGISTTVSGPAARVSAPGDVLETPCLLKAQGLRKAFEGQVVLDNVDIELSQGEVVLLQGENGSGKTTLLNILTGNIDPDAGRIHYLADATPRAYDFPRRWWQELNPFDHFTPEFVAREGIGRTWQHVRLFGTQSLRNNIASAALSQPGENPLVALLSPSRSTRREAEINREAEAMLARLGMSGREDSSADKISLGQSKRVAIARAVSAGARVLFLDEPLAGLDHRGVIDVLALLRKLVHEQQLTLVIVEHIFNHEALHGLVTTNWSLISGKIKVSAADAASPSARGVREPDATPRPPWLSFFVRDGSEICDEPLPRGALLTRIRCPGVFRTPPRPVLEVKDLVVRRGPRTVIGLDVDERAAKFNLTLYQGELSILQAPNGWGKSTLLAAICGLVPAAEGSILLAGKPLDKLAPWERTREGLRALTSDQPTFPTLLVKEVLALAGKKPVDVGLGSLAGRVSSSLSGGQRQRLALACLPPAEMVIYDEPFATLDSEAFAAVCPSLEPAAETSRLILAPMPLMTSPGRPSS